MAGVPVCVEHRAARAAATSEAHRDALDDLGAERVGQEVARRSVGQPAALQIEQLLGVELADGGAVRALDVVGEDLELRLGVDVRLVGSAAGCGSDCAESVSCAPGRTMILPLNTACAAPPTMHLCSWRLRPFGCA